MEFSSRSRPQLTRHEVNQVEHLYLQEAQDLYRYARSRSWGGESEARDLVQTTFHEAIRGWRKVGGLGPDERRKWLRRVLMNKIVDLSRKQQRVDLTPDISALGARSTDDTGERAEFAIALARCWQEIEQMPPVRRKVALLVWGESWATKRVAARLGLAESTVRGHLREARKQLRASVGHLVPFIDDEEEQESGW
ncbi:sigma-70 family RNA polymerase sigma factor [Micromonospora sp. NPDC023956]|uniref:RNA polymerase sigma factor n=1 Tax=Micromonospora sp. NPDC023956 TaxID=3155722 RepID=UPI0033F1EC2A